ncbi:MAG: MFS transporter [Actinomycetota bacterium]|nr:MFS transporter [Actinomycetota bacterium]MDD5667992.1 MFS transporter [Actinomycetota bacterium]
MPEHDAEDSACERELIMLGEGETGPAPSPPPVETAARKPLRGSVLSAFGYRDFSIIWSGALLSNIGTWIHMSALFWYVKEITGSDTWVGLVTVANFVPVFFLVLFAGSMADVLNRKLLIIFTQAVMMLSALALGVFTSFGASNLAVIMVITTVMGIAFTFNFPAWRAIITDLVEPGDILNAVALDAAEFNVARFIGPWLGGMIVSALSVSAAFYINAGSFLTIIGALILVRTKTPRGPAPPHGTLRHVHEIIVYVRKNHWALNVLVVLSVASIFGLPFIVLLPGMAKDVLGSDARGYGLLLGFVGLGAAASAPFVTWLNRRFKESEIIKISALISGLFLVGFSLSRLFWLSLLLSAGLGSTFLMLSAAVNTVLQARVERNMRGRIMSMYILVFQGLMPVGGIVMGTLADRYSAPSVLLAGGLVCAAMSVALIAFPSFLRDVVTR